MILEAIKRPRELLNWFACLGIRSVWWLVSNCWSRRIWKKLDSGLCLVVISRMARGYGKRARARRQRSRRNDKASSSQGLVSPTKATQEAWEVGHQFQEHCSEAAKKEVEVVRAVFRAQRLTTHNIQILEEVHDWVTDLMYSRTRDTKYFKIVETY